MYQYALVKMLRNVPESTFHPIFYYDKPFPGGIEDGNSNDKIIRYKSKGHHTTGFNSRPEAIASANELIERLKNEFHDSVIIELDEIDDILWDGKEIPADTQIRPFPDKVKIS